MVMVEESSPTPTVADGRLQGVGGGPRAHQTRRESLVEQSEGGHSWQCPPRGRHRPCAFQLGAVFTGILTCLLVQPSHLVLLHPQPSSLSSHCPKLGLRKNPAWPSKGSIPCCCYLQSSDSSPRLEVLRQGGVGIVLVNATWAWTLCRISLQAFKGTLKAKAPFPLAIPAQGHTYTHAAAQDMQDSWGGGSEPSPTQEQIVNTPPS